MTSLELRIHSTTSTGSAYRESPPMLHNIVRRFEPDPVRHVVNALWTQRLLSRTPIVRKGAHRGFVLTEQGKAVVGGGNVG